MFGTLARPFFSNIGNSRWQVIVSNINQYQRKQYHQAMGRGDYYKSKYGGGNKRNQVQYLTRDSGSDATKLGDNDTLIQGEDDSFSTRTPIGVTHTHMDLVNMLHYLEKKQYGAYKRLSDFVFQFPDFSLKFLYVQGDAYAPPSSLEVCIPHASAQFPKDLYKNSIRKMAFADYLNRHFAHTLHATNQHYENTNGWSGQKGGTFSVLQPSVYVLERSCVSVTSHGIEVRFNLGLPARGRTILGHLCAELLSDILPNAVSRSFLASTSSDLDLNSVRNHVECVEDQEFLRSLISQSKEHVGFIADGSILPRTSGVTELPLSTARPWQSPDKSWEVSYKLPNRGVITGTGIPRGITLITGGGFHGKSTVLSALAVGMLNKIPGDGREFVIVDDMTSLVQSEDGRCVHSVDISPFIKSLPLNTYDPKSFTCTDASGSTSLAAHIQESRELGVRVLLMDEDTCATNFMVRDTRMHALIGSNEPITPFTARITDLSKTFNVSCILVVGSSGAYLDVADRVLGMVEYVPVDWTSQAQLLVSQDPQLPVPDSPLTQPSPRVLNAVPRVIKSKIIQSTRAELILNSPVPESVWITGQIPSLVERGQMKFLVDALQYLARLNRDVCMAELMAMLTNTDMRVIANRFEGEHVRPRGLDVIAALSRLRGVSIIQK